MARRRPGPRRQRTAQRALRGAALGHLLREAHQESLEELKRREADCSVALTDWIDAPPRAAPIGHTINHPTQASLRAGAAPAARGTCSPTTGSGPELFEAMSTSENCRSRLHPWVQQALELGAWATRWGQRRGTPFPIADQLAGSRLLPAPPLDR